MLFSSNNGTCTISTDLMSLNVVNRPIKPAEKQFEFCQNQKSNDWELFTPDSLDVFYYWNYNDEIGQTKQPEINLQSAGNQLLFYAIALAKECPSEKNSIAFTVHPTPALPVSTSSAEIEEGQLLTFSAKGNKLKWYANATTKTFQTNNPTEQKLGKHDYYVSQTSEFGCEGPKLKITAEIIEAFGITTQPKDQVNCDGNSVTFSVKAKGSDAVTYQWQVFDETKNEFINIAGQASKDLKINDVGLGIYLNKSKFRCLINNGNKQIISNSSILLVNEINSKINDLSVCKNEKLNLNNLDFESRGNYDFLELQKKQGSTFSTIYNFNLNDKIFNTDSLLSGDYRIKVPFKTSGSGTCIRYTNNFKVSIMGVPEKSVDSELNACHGSNLWATLKPNQLLYSLDSIPAKNLKLSDTLSKTYLIKNINSSGCKSEFSRVNLKILNTPDLNLIPDELKICRFDSKLNFDKLVFYKSSLDSIPLSLEINSKIENEYTYFASYKALNSCESSKKKIAIKVNNCYENSQIDTCQSGNINILNNIDNFILNAENQILASIYSKKNIYTNTVFKTTFFKADLRYDLLPKSLNIRHSRSMNEALKITVYFDAKTIINYYKSNNQIAILRQNYNANCIQDSSLNAAEFISFQKLKPDAQAGIYTLDFEITNWGQYKFLVVPNNLTSLSAEIENKNNKLILSTLDNNANAKIQKSEDGISWFDFYDTKLKNTIIDFQPFYPKTYYRLVYKTALGLELPYNTLTLERKDSASTCFVFPNPVLAGENLKLYFPNLDKNTLGISTLEGKIINLEYINQEKDYYLIEPVSAFSLGNYVVFGRDKNGNYCYKRIIIK